MKLFVIATLVAMAAAGRLENLERAYLPSDSASNGSISSPSTKGSIGANSGAFGAAGAGLPRHNAGIPSAGATSNQDLPSDQGSSASNSAPQIAGQDSEVEDLTSQQSNDVQTAQTYSSPKFPQAQIPKQVLAKTKSFQNHPQQAFDEETGYHYGAPQSSVESMDSGSSATNFRSQQFNGRQAAPAEQSAAPSSQYKSIQPSNSFGAPSYQGQQFGAASRQYPTSNTRSYQNLPQQAFDEQTGYNYDAPQTRQGFRGQNLRSQQYNGYQSAPAQQYAPRRSQFGNLQAASSVGVPSYQAPVPQYSGAASRQYQAPRTSSFQNYPQQAFDEQTGYHY